MKASRRSLVIAVAAALSTVAGLVPASAQVPADATVARVDDTNVLAGTANNEFRLTVKHRLGLPVNAVIISTPSGGYTLNEGRAAGWDALRITNRSVLFTGNSISPGAEAVFNMFANVPVPAQDVTSAWSIRVSSDGGQTSSQAAPDPGIPLVQSAGTLNTIIRVLQVTAFAITAPAGATDNTVTGTQSNVTAVCRVQNAGSGLLNVAAEVESDDGDFTVTQAPAGDIASGASRDYTVGMTFNDVTSNNSDDAICDASSPGKASTGPFGADFGLTIQPRAVFSYIEDTLSPELTAPGARPSFQVEILKRQNGSPTPLVGSDQSPAVTLNQAATTFALPNAGCEFGPTGLASPTTIDSGRQNEFILRFAAALVPLDAEEGRCGVTMRIVGTDANGRGFATIPNVPDDVLIDAKIPQIADLNISGPGSRCCGAAAALKNGDTADLSGQATDSNPETGNQDPCENCSVVSADLVQRDTEEGGNIVARTPVTLEIDEDSGEMSGEYTGGYVAAARSVQLAVIVADATGTNHSDETFSNLVPIDNIPPKLVRAVATRAPSTGGEDLQRLIVARFDEQVDIKNQPTEDGSCPGGDWRVDDNSVASCQRANNFLSVSLLTAEELPDDGPELGSLAYFPAALFFHDRVAHNVPLGSTVDIEDKIPPLAPEIDQVDGKDADDDDDRFYTRDSTARFDLSGNRAVKAGYTVQLWRESNGKSGLQTDGVADQKIGQEVAAGNEVSITPDIALPSNAAPGAPASGVVSRIYGRSLDTATPKNPTPPEEILSVLVVVDVIAPGLATNGIVPDAGDIDITFTESVFGRDFSFDWEVENDAGDILNTGEVTGESNRRSLEMNDGRYNANEVARVQFIYLGPDADRYQDKAGNVLANFNKFL